MQAGSPPVQHIAWHAAVDPPPRVQLWKQDRLLAQAPSARQFCVCMQQFATMHWLHGVPPGSMVQVPASTGIPQRPLSQIRPPQHCWAVLQFDPMGRHVWFPHTPLWQTLEQQSEAVLHTWPSIRHPLMPQSPLKQLPLQHWELWLHPTPSGEQLPELQVPVASQKPLQHSVGNWQALPFAEHVMNPHLPASHAPVQHSAAVAQAAPSAAQRPQTSFALQLFEQQGAVPLHGSPSVTQEAQVPLTKSHTVEQQSASEVHASPRGRQLLAAQCPARQLPEQQGGAPWPQKSPFSVQLPEPQRFEVQLPEQHSAPLAQGEPSGTHIERLQAPAVHSDEQHWADEVQAMPSPRQAWVRQVPA
jgi:hypothetical protein